MISKQNSTKLPLLIFQKKKRVSSLFSNVLTHNGVSHKTKLNWLIFVTFVPYVLFFTDNEHQGSMPHYVLSMAHILLNSAL